jgi:hypothetical protein
MSDISPDFDKIKQKCVKDHSRFINSYIDHNLTNDIKKNYDREFAKYNQMKEIMRDVTIHHPRIMAHILELNSKKSDDISLKKQNGGNNDLNVEDKIVKNIQSVFGIIKNTDIDKMKHKSDSLINYMKKISDSVKTINIDQIQGHEINDNQKVKFIDSESDVIINNMAVLASVLNKFDQYEKIDGQYEVYEPGYEPGYELGYEPGYESRSELETEKTQETYDKIISDITTTKYLTQKLIDTTVQIKDHLYGKYPDIKYYSIKTCLIPKISDVILIIHKYLSTESYLRSEQTQTQIHQSDQKLLSIDKILLDRLLMEYSKSQSSERNKNEFDFLESYNSIMNTYHGKNIVAKLNIFFAESFRQENLSLLSNLSITLRSNYFFKNTIDSDKKAKLFMNEYNMLVANLQMSDLSFNPDLNKALLITDNFQSKLPNSLRMIPCVYPIKNQDYIEKSQNDIFNKSKRTKVLHNLTKKSKNQLTNQSLTNQSSTNQSLTNHDVIIGGSGHTIDEMNKMIKSKKEELVKFRSEYDLARIEYFRAYSDVYSYVRCMILIGTNQLSTNNHVIHKYLDRNMVNTYKTYVDKICDDMENMGNMGNLTNLANDYYNGSSNTNSNTNSKTRYVKRYCESIMKRLKIFLSNLSKIMSVPEDILDVKCINDQNIKSDIVLLNHFKCIIETYNK